MTRFELCPIAVNVIPVRVLSPSFAISISILGQNIQIAPRTSPLHVLTAIKNHPNRQAIASQVLCPFFRFPAVLQNISLWNLMPSPNKANTVGKLKLKLLQIGRAVQQ